MCKHQRNEGFHRCFQRQFSEHCCFQLGFQTGETEWKKVDRMSLGLWRSCACKLKAGSRAAEIYGKELIQERHRHRLEFNNQYKAEFEANGMIISGVNPDTQLGEIIEVPAHPWYVGVQFHPEYSSTVLNPHPLFLQFVKAAASK